MREREFDRLLARWAAGTRLRESEAAETLRVFASAPGPTGCAEIAWVGHWLEFWQRIGQVLRSATDLTWLTAQE